MKFSEVIKKLEEDSSMQCQHLRDDDWLCVVSTDHGYFELKIYNENGKLISTELAGGAFNGNLHKDYEWELVMGEVTDFVRAINSGKRIRPVNTDIDFMDLNDVQECLYAHLPLNFVSLVNGKWEIQPNYSGEQQ